MDLFLALFGMTTSVASFFIGVWLNDLMDMLLDPHRRGGASFP